MKSEAIILLPGFSILLAIEYIPWLYRRLILYQEMILAISKIIMYDPDDAIGAGSDDRSL